MLLSLSFREMMKTRVTYPQARGYLSLVLLIVSFRMFRHYNCHSVPCVLLRSRRFWSLWGLISLRYRVRGQRILIQGSRSNLASQFNEMY